MTDLWRGNIATRLRIASGLVLFTYALLHFINIGLGLFSPHWVNGFQDARQIVTRSALGSLLIYGAFVVHIALALGRLAGRRSLRMPPWEAVQIILGLLIPTLLIAHLVHTRTAHEIFAVNDEVGYILALIYGHTEGWKQSALLLIVWVHGTLGLHFWLRSQGWWRRHLPLLAGLAMLVPGFALAGFLVEGRRIAALMADETTRAGLISRFNFPDRETFGQLITASEVALWVYAALIALVAAIYAGRQILIRRHSVLIRYVDGPEIAAPKGMTLLEMSRAKGVDHAALCGGRGRCTTCRVVIEDGAEGLHPPSPAEARSLGAVNAGPQTRLACQIRPETDTTVFRVFRPDGRRQRAHAVQGIERELALLFLDMRGFTARTTGQLPYDVVFLLNRFFDAIVPPILRAGGSVDKYLGDGFLAVFELPDPGASAQAALRAIEDIAQALDAFNDTLAAEGQSPLAIGIGAHLGTVVLGEIGAAGQAPRTLIGDTVNTASRLEGATKDHRVQAFISAPLLQAAGHDLPQEHMLALELRGVSRPLWAWPVPQAHDLHADLNRTNLTPAG